MSIKGLDQDEFKAILRTHLTPARAIKSPEHLRGRANKLQVIDRAFNSPGKHIFIYGDRGVGKTSLAQTAAVLHQPAGAEPIVLACDQGSGFFQIVRDMAKRCVPSREVFEKAKTGRSFSIKVPGISYDLSKSIESGVIPEIDSINDAINVIRYLTSLHSREPVVIIDEFDQLKSDRERKYFADFLKQVSDQNVGIRLIFCGIGSSLDELIGVHLSTGRYIAPIELERLSHDARWEIITSAAQALGVTVDREYFLRVGLISDGFPYYVHLIGEMIFWAMFDDVERVSTCMTRHFDVGVRGAVSEAETSLKYAYERATQKYSDDYQEVLWAVADDAMLRRQVTDIYERSYIPIMEHRPGRRVLEKKRFYDRMNKLKTPQHGSILMTTGAGWYQFRENIVRGYVRLRAQEHGVRLGRDHYAPADAALPR